MSARAGVTLIELLTVLAILGLLAVITAPAWRRSAPIAPTPTAQVRLARRAAIELARDSLIPIPGDTPRIILVRADGSVLGASFLAIDRVTGRPPADSIFHPPRP